MTNIFISITAFILFAACTYLSYKIYKKYEANEDKAQLNWWNTNKQWFWFMWALVFFIAGVVFAVF